jgi:predicted dehydrogenase
MPVKPVINTALLSFGLSGRVFHAPLLEAHPGFRLAGAWERSTKAIATHYPHATSYETLEALLADQAVDLVVVNTPTATHYDYTRQALERGKHVLTEKAFTTTAGEARTLDALAQKQGCKLAVFQNRRWDSDFLAVQRVLADGFLGDIIEANLGFCRYKPELSGKTHKEEPGPGAGIIKDLGAHVIDQALLLFDMPIDVYADIAITRPGSKVDDYFDILLRYPDRHVHVKGGYFFRQPLPEYSLFGMRGSFLKSRADPQEAQLERGLRPDDPAYGREADSSAGRLYLDRDGATASHTIPSPPGNYLGFYEGLHRAIAYDKPEPVSASDGVRVMQIIDAAFESQKTGRRIALPRP